MPFGNLIQPMPERDFEAKYRTIAFWGIALLVVVASGMLLAPFFPALMWAAVFSVLMMPFYRRLRKRMADNLAAGLTVLGTLALIVVPLVAIGIVAVVQVGGIVSDIQAAAPAGQTGLGTSDLLDRLDAFTDPLIKGVGAKFKVSDWISENGKDLGQRLSGPLGKLVYSIGFGIFTLVVALLTMFFMLRDGGRLKDPALQLIPLPPEKAEALMLKMADTIRAVFQGVVLVALIQGTLAGIAYAIAGAPSPMILALATTILCVIPLLGAPVIYVPVGLALIAQGRPLAGALLLAFGFGVISQIDNVLRPFVISAKVPLHPMAIFFSLLGGVLALGPVGIMAGPVLLTVLMAIQEIVRERRTQGETAMPETAFTLEPE